MFAEEGKREHREPVEEEEEEDQRHPRRSYASGSGHQPLSPRNFQLEDSSRPEGQEEDLGYPVQAAGNTRDEEPENGTEVTMACPGAGPTGTAEGAVEVGQNATMGGHREVHEALRDHVEVQEEHEANREATLG